MSRSLTKSPDTNLRLKKSINYNSKTITYWYNLLSHLKASTCKNPCKKKRLFKAKLRFRCSKKSMLSSRENSYSRFRSFNPRTLISRAKSLSSLLSWTTIKRSTVSNKQSMQLLNRSIKNFPLSERSGTFSKLQRSQSMSLKSLNSSLTTRSKFWCSSLNTRLTCLSLSQLRRMALKERSS
jgi:hypothetical protein